MLIFSDVSYIGQSMTAIVLLCWMLKKVRHGRSAAIAAAFVGPLHGLHTHFKTKSHKMFISTILVTSLMLYTFCCVFMTCLKYSFGYIQIPNKVVFIERPVETWNMAGSIGCMTFFAALASCMKMYAVFVTLLLLHNVAILAAESQYVVGGNTSSSSAAAGKIHGKSAAAASASDPYGSSVSGGAGANSPSAPAAVVVHAGISINKYYWALLASIVMIVVALVAQGMTGIILFLIHTVWTTLNILRATRISHLLGKMTQEDAELAAANPGGHTPRVPLFRIIEQQDKMNLLRTGLVLEWLGLLVTMLVGEGRQRWLLDVFTAVYLVGALLDYYTPFSLLYPDDLYCYERKMGA